MQLADSTFENFEKAKALIDLLDRRQALKKSFMQTPEPLLGNVAKLFGRHEPGLPVAHLVAAMLLRH